jgi:phosphoadenosine phosphosulfate reductase
MALFKNGAFATDPWNQPSDAGAILTVAQWRERRDGPPKGPLGLRLDPGFAVETLGDDVAAFALIAIPFPKFTDGRAYSMAWMLRSRLAYRGELRATGDVLFDEMQFMARCGFDAFDITDATTLRLLSEGRRAATFDRFYQPGLEPEIPEGTRPWARHAVSPRGNHA